MARMSSILPKIWLIPGPIIYDFFIPSAGGDQVGITLHPPVRILKTLHCIRRRGGIKQSGRIQILGIQETFRFIHKVVNVFLKGHY